MRWTPSTSALKAVGHAWAAAARHLGTAGSVQKTSASTAPTSSQDCMRKSEWREEGGGGEVVGMKPTRVRVAGVGDYPPDVGEELTGKEDQIRPMSFFKTSLTR